MVPEMWRDAGSCNSEIDLVLGRLEWENMKICSHYIIRYSNPPFLLVRQVFVKVLGVSSILSSPLASKFENESE